MKHIKEDLCTETSEKTGEVGFRSSTIFYGIN
jgi:hypothetical protein